jgi:hypothetical protein
MKLYFVALPDDAKSLDEALATAGVPVPAGDRVTAIEADHLATGWRALRQALADREKR